MKTFLEHIQYGLYEGSHVPLEMPMIEEEELNKPKRGGSKKFYVYVKDGDKVKISLRYRGREMAHREIGIKVLERVKEETKDISKVELEPKLEGRQAVMILTPEEKK